MEHSPIETHNELPSFVPERELRAALAAAQNVARQRDELATELARAKRDLESSARSQRELDEAMRGGGDNLGRRIKLLRDALARKDQEILNLKTFTATHAKQLKDAQETAERLRRERGELEHRLKSRDGAFSAIERERENLSRALDGARRDGERAAQVVMQADTAVHEWRAALEACTRELDEARRQLAELRGAWNALTHERQRIVEAHAQEVGTVRAEADATAQRLRDEMEQALSDATSRYDAAREAHAIALRAAEDEHEAEIAEERASRRVAEEALSDARVRVSQLEAARNWADGELAALRTRLESAESIAETIARELQESFGREIDALRKAHEAERESLAAAYEAELKAINGALQGVVLPKGFRSMGEAYADAEGRARALAAEVEAMRGRVAARRSCRARVRSWW